MPYSILLADDSRVMRAMILRTLRLAGLPIGEVHEAADGRAALEAFQRHRVDLALIDINMPVMDGAELISRLRADERGAVLPILVVSTESSRTRVAELQRMGARFVHKPFTPEQLRDALRSIAGDHDHTGTGAGAARCGDADF